MRKTFKRVLALMFCFALTAGSVPVQAAKSITPSTKEYELIISDAYHVFIGNEKKVGWEVGDTYFLTYTVSELNYNQLTQCGAVVTADNTVDYPHTKGGMQYLNEGNLLCEEGWTYFFRFEVTEKGLNTIVARAKGDAAEYIRLPSSTGDVTTPGSYFGAWMSEGGKLSAKLTHVRCYDEVGNDLGIYVNNKQGIGLIDTAKLVGNPSVDHSYSFSLSEAVRVAFGNLRSTSSDVIYLEYTISNVAAEEVTQSGVTMTKQPTEPYPHGANGFLRYLNGASAEALIAEGASYLIRFERNGDSYEAWIKRTLDGIDTYYYFGNFYIYGKYEESYGYVTTWFGEVCSLTADFTNVKCYDAEGNNLGIQTNQGVTVKHYGPLEDYSDCISVYYCEANNTFITLEDDCNASKRVDGEDAAEMGTYSIRQAVLALQIGEKTEEFDYAYASFKDKDDNTYVRLKESTVTFLSRAMGGEILETQQASAENGYKISKPDDPKAEERTFAYWAAGDGEEYDFNKVVVENMDVYAAWEGEGAYASVGIPAKGLSNTATVVVAVICAAMVAGTTAGIVIVSRRKSDGKTKEKNK